MDQQTVQTQEPDLLSSLSEEAFEAAKNEAGRLARLPIINGVCVTLITSRQIYAVARAALNRLIGEHATPDANKEAAEEILVRHMAQVAMKEFDVSDVLQRTAGIVLTCLESEIAGYDVRNSEEEDAVLEKHIKDGKATRGNVHNVLTGEPLPKGDIVIIAGARSAVRYVMNEALEAVRQNYELGRQPNVVLHLVDQLQVPQTLTRDAPEYLQVGSSKWLGCAKSNTKFERLVRDTRQKLKDRRLDALIVDDVLQLYADDSLTGPFMVEKAIRSMSKDASLAGYAIFAGLPLRSQSSDLDEVIEAYRSRLKNLARTAIKVVRVEEVGEHLKLLVDGSPYSVTVTKEYQQVMEAPENGQDPRQEGSQAGQEEDQDAADPTAIAVEQQDGDAAGL